MPETSKTLISPYCTVDWATSFFRQYHFSEEWGNASPEKRLSAVCSATDFIDLFCMFYNEDGTPFFYSHSDEFSTEHPDDYGNDINPYKLKQACALEAKYLLGLDDNPAEPHPLTILGLYRGDFGQVDDTLVPPIFPAQVSKLLTSLGGEISPEANAGHGTVFFKREVT